MLVSELNIYPVKSMSGITLDSAIVERAGFQHDRRWMVVDAEGRFITQRQYPQMCLIQPRITEMGLVLMAPAMPALTVARPQGGDRRPVVVWDDQCNALDCGDHAAQWLRDFLQVACRLTYFPEDEFRQVDLAFAQPGDRTAFADGFPLLLISRASLDDLNSRMAQPVTMNRFRPNLVVDGCEPFAEDTWRRFRIGEVVFRAVKPCSRCTIPTIDPTTGVRGKEPTRTLSLYRKQGNNVYFGQNVIADGEGRLDVGMPVELLA